MILHMVILESDSSAKTKLQTLKESGRVKKITFNSSVKYEFIIVLLTRSIFSLDV